MAYNFDDSCNKDVDQESMIKTPKAKKGRKLSIRNNPEDKSATKVNKIMEKKYKIVTNDKEKNPHQLFGHWSVE